MVKLQDMKCVFVCLFIKKSSLETGVYYKHVT